MTSPLTVSVVVPTYRRPQVLQRCLAALSAQTRGADEIVVVARPSDEESLDAVAQWHGRLPIRVVAPAAPGIVPAISAGLLAVTGDVAAWTDDDAEPLPDWLERLAEWFADPHVAAVGGPDLPGAPGPEVRRPGTIRWFGQVMGGRPAAGFYVGPTDHLRGCNMAVRTPVPLPELRLQGDGSAYEMDICLRARLRGAVIFDTRVAVLHDGERRVPEAGIVTERPGADTAAACTAAYNLCLVLSKNTVGRLRRLAVLAFQLGVGQRQSLGLGRGLAVAVQDHDLRVVALTLEVVRHKLRGWRVGASAGE